MDGDRYTADVYGGANLCREGRVSEGDGGADSCCQERDTAAQAEGKAEGAGWEEGEGQGYEAEGEAKENGRGKGEEEDG